MGLGQDAGQGRRKKGTVQHDNVFTQKLGPGGSADRGFSRETHSGWSKKKNPARVRYRRAGKNPSTKGL